MKKVISIIIIVLIISLIAIAIKYIWETKTHVPLDLNYSESTQTIWNPERGWYDIYGCMVNENENSGKSLYKQFEKQHNEGDALVLLLFNLQKYNDGEISIQGLEYINNVLYSARDAGLKVIARFVYDWDGKALESEPENIQIVLNHMEQLRNTFYTHEDSIYLIQGIFVGNYGEMNNSKYLDDDDVITLFEKLIEVTPINTKLSVRTPEYWRMIQKKSDKAQELLYEKLGLYNDGLSSSSTDLGTYSDGTGYVNKWPRIEEIEFQSKLCDTVPNGGEVALESEYNDLTNIIKEFPQIHISYLNKGYNKDVLEKWENTIIYSSNKKNDPYLGIDGYKYIQDHLGYRFVLRQVSVSRKIFLNTKSEVNIEIENIGFANVYYSKDITILFEGVYTGDKMSIDVDTDIRKWNSGEVTNLTIPLPTQGLKEDSYRVFIKIMGSHDDVIQLSNIDIFDKNLEANAVGTIETKEFSLINLWK